MYFSLFKLKRRPKIKVEYKNSKVLNLKTLGVSKYTS